MISLLEGGIEKALNWLRESHPFTGRFMADDGVLVNIAEFIRRQPMSIARGEWPGAEPFGSYGERTSDGAETNAPIWPDGAIVPLPDEGAPMAFVSTSAADSAAGANARVIEMHYLDKDLDQKFERITMQGLTPVQTVAQDIRWIQYMHIHEWGANPRAAGIITASYLGKVYGQISLGKTLDASSFRMVPRGRVCYVDAAVGGSVSLTSDATTVMSIVASEIGNNTYHNPLMFLPIAAVGLQNGALGFNFPPGLRYSEGTLIGGIHTSGKAGTLTLSWFGRLEPAE